MLDQHHLSMRSCFAAQLDMVDFESFFYCTWLLYVLSRIFGHRYIVPYLKCNTHPEEKFRRIFAASRVKQKNMCRALVFFLEST